MKTARKNRRNIRADSNKLRTIAGLSHNSRREERNNYVSGRTVLPPPQLRIGPILDKDGASKGAVETSPKKAVTALRLKARNSDIMEKMKTDAALAAKVTADQSLFVRAGGVPLMVGSELLGAVGVGGPPGGDKDEACALAGIDKVKARMK